MNPGYTTAQFKYGNALNASSRATPRVHAGERKDVSGVQIYTRRRSALRIKELNA